MRNERLKPAKPIALSTKSPHRLYLLSIPIHSYFCQSAILTFIRCAMRITLGMSTMYFFFFFAITQAANKRRHKRTQFEWHECKYIVMFNSWWFYSEFVIALRCWSSLRLMVLTDGIVELGAWGVKQSMPRRPQHLDRRSSWLMAILHHPPSANRSIPTRSHKI